MSNIVDKYDLRIRGSGQNYGRLEVNMFDIWTPICASTWSNTEADIACRSLKFAGGGVTYYAEIDDKTPVLVDRFNCTGKTSFEQCSYKSFENEFSCRYTKDFDIPRRVAGVLCFPNKGNYNKAKTLALIICEIIFGGVIRWNKLKIYKDTQTIYNHGLQD